MSAIDYIDETVFPAAFSMLPARLDALAARAFMLAIGLQESRFEGRVQINGPARGFWQFETAGIKGVLAHPASRVNIAAALRSMSYDTRIASSHEAVAHNDILACIYARLLIWTSPLPLPKRDDAHGAWNYYLSCWRPGKPHPETWDGFYAQAWEIVE